MPGLANNHNRTVSYQRIFTASLTSMSAQWDALCFDRLIADAAPIVETNVENPKNDAGESKQRYDAYRSAKTVKQLHELSSKISTSTHTSSSGVAPRTSHTPRIRCGRCMSW